MRCGAWEATEYQRAECATSINIKKQLHERESQQQRVSSFPKVVLVLRMSENLKKRSSCRSERKMFIRQKSFKIRSPAEQFLPLKNSFIKTQKCLCADFLNDHHFMKYAHRNMMQKLFGFRQQN